MKYIPMTVVILLHITGSEYAQQQQEHSRVDIFYYEQPALREAINKGQLHITPELISSACRQKDAAIRIFKNDPRAFKIIPHMLAIISILEHAQYFPDKKIQHL